MKISIILPSIIIMFTSALAHSGASTEGGIERLYSQEEGNVVFCLEEGFNDAAKSKRLTYNGFTGTSTSADPILKPTLLSASIAKRKVKLLLEGCQGSWIKN
ncbi:hypothetical protein ACJJIP_07950 [Microbulbifer sp. VTAC004]|uniref:hypothetical protein n=1 Tax=unclassified Microbulbifer TaxID=2619833 RepID=UPI00403941DE